MTSSVASRELRNSTRALLDRVAAGEEIVITVDGLPVARLEPIERRRRWISREEFVRSILPYRADAQMAKDIRDLAPDTTDDLPPG